METLQAITTRRSIRKYTDKQVTEKDVQTILEAAMQAPSAMNEQLRQFVVIDDKALLSKIPSIHPRAAMVAECSVALLVCADLSRQATEWFRVHDCSIAAENILIAAHDLGLGWVFVAIHPREERIDAFKKLFNLPDTIIPLCIIPLGYPAEHKEPENRFDPKKVHHNKR